MKPLTAALLLALTACHRAKPLPLPPALPPVTPTVLVDPPYPGQKKVGAHPVFPGMYATGNGRSDNDRNEGCFRASQDYTLQRGDRGDVDPALVDAALLQWIEGVPGLKVTRRWDPAPGTRVVDYEAAETIGYVRYVIDAASPAPKVRYTLTVVERRR